MIMTLRLLTVATIWWTNPKNALDSLSPMVLLLQNETKLAEQRARGVWPLNWDSHIAHSQHVWARRFQLGKAPNSKARTCVTPASLDFRHDENAKHN